jgi:hypothetical protein
MRILLDENIPRGLRRILQGHDVRTASEMGWASIANGQLLDEAEKAGFDALEGTLRIGQSAASLGFFRRPVPACLSRAGARGRRPQPGRRKNFPGGRALLLAAVALQIYPEVWLPRLHRGRF